MDTIISGCSEFVCSKCGMPKRIEKIIKANPNAFNIRIRDVKEGRIKGHDRVATDWEVSHYHEKEYTSQERKIIQWGCDCNVDFIKGIVLDPFCGSGTALLVAKELGRDFIGIDIKPEYCDIAKKRLGILEWERGELSKFV